MAQADPRPTLFLQFLLFLLLLSDATVAFATENSPARESGWKIEGSLVALLPTGRIDRQSNAGIGLQGRFFRGIDHDNNEDRLAIGAQFAVTALPPKETDLSSFQIVSLGPELQMLLPSPSFAQPYLSLSAGAGYLIRTDDKRTNAVDYHFSEILPEGSAAFGVRLPVGSVHVQGELNYRYLSSRNLGESGLVGISLGAQW